MTTIAERVAAGVAFLDEHDPGWWRTDVERAINLGTLDLGSGCDCVLGQRRPSKGNPHFSYMEARRKLGLSPPEAQNLGLDSIAVVSDLELSDREYAGLTAEWKHLIAERRTAVAS